MSDEHQERESAFAYLDPDDRDPPRETDQSKELAASGATKDDEPAEPSVSNEHHERESVFGSLHPDDQDPPREADQSGQLASPRAPTGFVQEESDPVLQQRLSGLTAADVDYRNE